MYRHDDERMDGETISNEDVGYYTVAAVVDQKMIK